MNEVSAAVLYAAFCKPKLRALTEFARNVLISAACLKHKIGKLINDDFRYVDSKNSPGVQVADLIASGLRRVLRSHFDCPEKVAIALGTNMLQAPKGETTVRLSFLDQTGHPDEKTANLVGLIAKYSRPMLAR